MRVFSTCATQWIAGRIAGVTLLIALVLGLDFAASCSTLHQRLCPNAGKQDDACAIAVFAGGSFAGGSFQSSPAPLVLAAVVLMLIGATRWTGEDVASVPIFQLAPSRAPPRSVQLPG
jgi:hypothetical protein